MLSTEHSRGHSLQFTAHRSSGQHESVPTVSQDRCNSSVWTDTECHRTLRHMENLISIIITSLMWAKIKKGQVSFKDQEKEKKLLPVREREGKRERRHPEQIICVLLYTSKI